MYFLSNGADLSCYATLKIFKMHVFFSFLFPADIISTVEFNHTGELLATGDKGGRVVIFQQEIEVCLTSAEFNSHTF